MPTSRVVANSAASCMGGTSRMRLGKSVAADSLSKYRGTLPDAPAASPKERSRHFPGACNAVWRVSAWCWLEGLAVDLDPHDRRLIDLQPYFELVLILIDTDAIDGLSESYSCLKIGFDGPQLQTLRPGSQALIRTPQQCMQAMNDLLSEQEAPGNYGIHVQGVIVAGESCKSKLIVGCECALCHGSLWAIGQVQYAQGEEKDAQRSG